MLKQRPQKLLVRFALGKVAAAPQLQCLVQGPFELPVTLFDIPILVGLPGVDGFATQAIVLKQLLIPPLKGRPTLARWHGRGQSIGAVALWHTAQFLESVLQAVAETLKTLAEADRAGLPVGVGQHEMIDQVRKRLAADGDLQATGMREIGGTALSWRMDLGEKDFLGLAVQGPPLLEPPLQGPQLAVRKAAGILALQPGQEGVGLQARVDRQLFLDSRPDLGERIGPGPPGMFHTHLTGKSAQTPVLARGLFVEARLGGGLGPGQGKQIETTQTTNLLIGNHPKPPGKKGLRIDYGAADRSQRTGKSSCRGPSDHAAEREV